MNCHACGTALPPPPWYRGDLCPKCSASLHACVYCVHYSTAAYNECREPQADRVVDKEGSNFCDYFKPGLTGTTGDTGAAQKSAKAAFDALFKK